MPNLGNMLYIVAQKIRTTNGRVIRGFIRPPSTVLRSYNGTFEPRQLFYTAASTVVPLETVLLDSNNVRYLTAPWDEQSFGEMKLQKVFVLFEVTNDIVWTRPVTTVEPISGLRVSGVPAVMGTIPAVREPYGRETGPSGLPSEAYKVMCVAPVQLGDYLDGMLVRRIEVTGGITFAEVHE
ncbi:MAG TPA: hypothetical protein PLD10_15985 [Rhodopila sp.]|nr:hypothetical protein [Rhodopila sp.]